MAQLSIFEQTQVPEPIKEDTLPESWAWTTLSDLIAADGIFTDGDWVESKDQDANGDVRLIQLADVGDGEYRNRSARFLTSQKASDLHCTFLNIGDVLVARMPDPLGRACIFPGDSKWSVTVVDVCIIRTGTGSVNHRWLMYLINSPEIRAAIASRQSGSTRQRISRKNLSSIRMPVPPLAEQARIVAEIEQQFTRLDAGVAALKRAQANLKRYKAAVLKAACEGALVPQDPGDEPAAALLARILAARRAKWEADVRAKGKNPATARYDEPAAPDTDDLPVLPDGWCRIALEQVAEVGTGATPLRSKKAYYEGGSIPWITSGAANASFIAQAEEYITELAIHETNAKVFPIGTLLVAMYGEGRTRGKVSELSISAATNQALAALVFDTVGVLCKPYIKVFLDKNYDDIRRLSSGGVQPNLNLSLIKRTSIPVPPQQEQERIVAEVERRLSVMREQETVIAHSLTRAERLRQAILAQAFAGRLVPQDSTDEPANALLSRIRAARPVTAASRRTGGHRAG